MLERTLLLDGGLKHNKKKARAKFQAEKAANQAKKAAKAKKLQAAALK